MSVLLTVNIVSHNPARSSSDNIRKYLHFLQYIVIVYIVYLRRSST